MDFGYGFSGSWIRDLVTMAKPDLKIKQYHGITCDDNNISLRHPTQARESNINVFNASIFWSTNIRQNISETNI